MPDSALPPNLRSKRHWDWPWPFKYIPRGWTAFKWGAPRMLLGNQGAHCQTCDGDMFPSPIGEPETWQVSYFPNAPWWALPIAWYVAWSGSVTSNPKSDDVAERQGMFTHLRFGARWDNVDDYVQWPTVAKRRYTGIDSQDTSTT